MRLVNLIACSMLAVGFLAPLALADASLAPRRLFNGVGRPLEIEVSDRMGDGGLELALLDANGAICCAGVPIDPGVHDLAAIMPDVWNLRQAAYLQLMRGDEPIGPSLVLQPMINRPPIWTVRDTRPGTNVRYTRIVGWGNEAPPDWRSAIDGDAVVDDVAPADATPPAGATDHSDDAPEPDEETFTGLRAYVEHDVVLVTSLGEIVIALRADQAPNTTWNFRQLVQDGFYRDVIFHRIVPLDRNGNPFVIQGGDPSGTGNGGAGYWLPMEPSRLNHDFGVISMARADDPDSAGTQFFFCLSREGTARLDGQYCAFGYAVRGAKTIRDIASVRLADVSTGRPEDPPVILDARLIPAPPRSPGIGRPDRRVLVTDDLPAPEPDGIDR